MIEVKNRVCHMLVCALLSLGLFACVIPVRAYAATQISQNDLVAYLESQVGSSYQSNYCLKYVREVFQHFGASYSSACCAHKYGSSYLKSTSKDNIPIGADVFFQNNSGITCDSCGNDCGHVGIYVGNGYYISVISGKVQKVQVNSSYWGKYYRGWGYHGGVEIIATPQKKGNRIAFDLQGGAVGTYTQQAVIAGTNCERGYNSIVYNVSGATVPTNEWGVEAAVDAAGKIVYFREYRSQTQIKVPEGGFVLSQHVDSSDLVWGAKEGNYIGLDYATMKAYLYTDVDSYLVNHKEVKEGTAYGALPTPTRDGYTFDGWYTAASGGTKITESSNYSVNKLYAHWTEAHNYVSTVHEPTCEEQGYTEYNCTLCGASYQDDIVEALGHNYSRQTVKQATCTASGSYKDVCTRCSKTVTGQIDALGHSYEYVTVEGDCVTPPIQQGTCRRCGDVTESISDDAWSAWSTTVPTGFDSSDIQSRKEYRYRTKQTATSRESSLSGWTLEGTTQVWDEYGGWSWWTDTVLTASDSTEVETAKVYRYYYFLCNKCGDHNPLSGGCTCGGTSNDFHEYWSTVPYSQSSSSVVSYATHKRTTTSVGGGTVYYFSSGNLNDTAIGTKDSGSSAAVIVQGYRSRTRTSHTEYTYYKWSSWSDWSTTSVTATSNREVETRTVYRYNLYANVSHAWDNGTVTKAATCTVNGVRTFSCTACSATRTETILATGHTIVTDAAKAVTCTASGLTEGKHCSVCNTVTVAQQTIPAKGHTEVSDAAKAATCTASGLTEGKHCSVCNVVTKAQQVVPAKGHTEVTDAAEAATCTATGLTKGSHCSVCNTVLKEQTVVPMIAHDYDVTKLVLATSSSNGHCGGVSCQLCGKTLTRATVISSSRIFKLPKQLTEIGEEAFMGLSMQQVEIPDGVTKIGARAFADCDKLSIVIVPDSITSIAEDAFEDCGELYFVCSSRTPCYNFLCAIGNVITQ